MTRFTRAFAETIRAIAGDRYARTVLLGAVVLYSFFYPVAYRQQVAAHLPVAVVDLDGSAHSRELVRRISALRAVEIRAELPSMAVARSELEYGRVDGIVTIPAGFEREILRGGQGDIALFAGGAFLGRTATVLEGLRDAATAFAREAAAGQARFAGVPQPPPIQLISRPLFNAYEGYGSAIVPGVAQLIVQQTLLIGMLVMAGTRRERLGPLAFSRAGLAGIAAAFVLLGMASLLYYNGLVLWLQDYPAGGNLAGLLLGGALYVGAIVALALFLGSFFRTRERPFQLLILSSLPLLFLSGLSWPRSAMPVALAWLGKLVPSTAGIEAMMRFNQMGASLREAAPELLNLALLIVLYASLAVWRYRPRAAPGFSPDPAAPAAESRHPPGARAAAGRPAPR